MQYDEILSGKKDGLIRRTLTGAKREELRRERHLSLHRYRISREWFEELKNRRKYSADGGLAILLDSKTGKVLSYAGTYNWDLGLMGIFEPGSTIKPLIYSLALTVGAINEEMTFSCDGRIQPVPGLNIVIRDVEGERHGVQTFREAIINSCNVATVQVGGKIFNTLGRNEMYTALEKIGFGRLSGVDLPGETPGIFPQASTWSLISPYQFPIGQGLGVNIFQMVKALNVFPAGGQFIVPTFLKAIRNEDGFVNVRRLMEFLLPELVATMPPFSRASPERYGNARVSRWG